MIATLGLVASAPVSNSPKTAWVAFDRERNHDSAVRLPEVRAKFDLRERMAQHSHLQLCA
jgi:hypothetical protein